jgi:hypothetical protein
MTFVMMFLMWQKGGEIMDIDPITGTPSNKWRVMNDLEQAFNQITTFDFLLTQLQEAVDNNDHQQIVDATLALNAFYHPYCNNWDNKFKEAWKEVITKDRGSHHSSVNNRSQWEEYWATEALKSLEQKQE